MIGHFKGASPPLLADGWGGDVVQRSQRENCTLNGHDNTPMIINTHYKGVMPHEMD